MMKADFQPKIVGILCNWCSYAGADLAGTSRLKYPENIRIIKVPCSGRVNPLFIIRCFQQEGIDGVLISGCHPGDCHYITGNYFARRKFALIDKMLEFMGVEKGRVQFSWVSGGEGIKWVQVVEKVVNDIKSLGPFTKFK